MTLVEIKCEKGDLRHETFLKKAQWDLKMDGNAGIGLIKYKCSYLVDELNNYENILAGNCQEIICSKYYEDNGLWQIGQISSINSKKDIPANFPEIKKYLGKPFDVYLKSGLQSIFQSAEYEMADEEINNLAIYSYENEINEKYKGIYSIFEYSLMQNCSFDLEKIPDRLKENGTKYPGLTSGYVFVGRRGSHSGIHSEDYELPSININFSGKIQNQIFLTSYSVLSSDRMFLSIPGFPFCLPIRFRTNSVPLSLSLSALESTLIIMSAKRLDGNERIVQLQVLQ